MKVFLISVALFLLLAILVTFSSIFMGLEMKKLADKADEAALCALSEEDGEARLLFYALEKKWEKFHVYLLLSIHHSTLKEIELALTDAKIALALEKRESFYSSLTRISKGLSSLSDDLMLPAL